MQFSKRGEPMKVVIAPDAFKECLSAQKVSAAIARGWRRVLPDTNIVQLPMADGGEGTLATLVDATGGTLFTCIVTGPIGAPVEARYGLLGNTSTAVIEMAQASGLEAVPKKWRNPLMATSFGTGELMVAALDHGVSNIIVTLGGSATNDGGAGMLAALGVRFLNAQQQDIGYIIEDFDQLASIDISEMDSRLNKVRFVAACDVDNPVLGPSGASAVFGPQKGASPTMVDKLELRLTRYMDILEHTFGQAIRHQPGAGAAGAMAAALMAFMGAELKPGIDLVVEASGLKAHLQDASLVITGEGRIDSQTLNGKTPLGVARYAKQFNVPVIALGGSVSDELELLREAGVDVAFSVINTPGSLTESIAHAETNLRQMGETLASFYRLLKTS